MIGEGLVLVANFLILCLFILWNKKRQKLYSNTSTYVIGLYATSALFSILYYFTPIFEFWYHLETISFFPMIYWLVVFYFSSSPLILYDKNKFKAIKYNPFIVEVVCIAGLVCGSVYLADNLMKINTLLSENSLDVFVELHDEGEGNVNYSLFSRGCRFVLEWIKYPLYVFIYPAIKEKNPMLLTGCIVGILSTVLPSVLMGSRSALINVVFVFIFVYLLYSPYLSLRRKTILKKYGLIITSVALFFFLTITIVRGNDYSEKNSNFTFYTFITRYAGEGFLNFFQYADKIKENVGGEYCFTHIYNLLGGDIHTGNAREYLSGPVQRMTGIPMMQFYTYIGFFVIDIGLVGTLIFWILLSRLVCKSIYSNTNVLYLSNILILFIYSIIIVNGLCLYMFSWSNDIQLYKALVIVLIMKHFKS